MDRFKWNPQQVQRDWGPPQYEDPIMLHRTEWYGPWVCEYCWGVGWMRDSSGIEDDAAPVRASTLVKCSHCGTIDRNRAASFAMTAERIWEVSSLEEDPGWVPQIADIIGHDEATRTLVKTVKGFIEKPEGWLTIHGSWGAGKSHVAEAMARELLAKRIPCLYMRSSELWEYCGAGWRSDQVDYARRENWINWVPVLVIDEFMREKETGATPELRGRILDARWRKAVGGGGGATVLVSNFAPSEWQDGAIASRATDGRFRVVESSTVDFRKVAR